MTDTTTGPVDTSDTGTDTAPPVPPRAGADEDREPILAEWLRERSVLVDTVRRTIRRNWYRLLRHSTWLPVYMARLVKWSPRGLWRVGKWLWWALLDEETRTLQHQHAGRGETAEWLALERRRKDRLRNRMIAFCVIVGLVSVGFLLLWLLVSPVLFGATSALVILILGGIGRPRGKKLLNTVPLVDGAPPPPSAPIITEALCSIGVPKMNDPQSIGVLSDVARIYGGYQVDLELTKGVTAGEVIEKRPKLAAALRRELDCVWPRLGKRNEAHLELTLLNESVAKAKQRPWPYMTSGQTNIFQPIPMFTDQCGQWINQKLAYLSGVVGGMPGSGKTFYMRQVGLVFALDPRTVIYAYDLKSTGDFGPLSLVAHGYSLNDDEEDTLNQLEQITRLHDDMRRRVKTIRKIAESDRTLCPENKVTDYLASQKELDLGPVLLLVDECQEWFEHANQDIRKEFIRLSTDFVKRGRAAGIHAFFGTQKPDMKSLPTPISANTGIRLCLRVQSYHANDAVLGTGSHAAGFNAMVFTDDHKGMGYLRGESSGTQLVRTVSGLDAVVAEKIALRARAVREAQGRLTGYAAGETMDDTMDEISYLDDCRTVTGSSDAIHLTDLAAGLARLREATYGGLTAHSVGAQLREIGIEPRTVWADGRAGKGVKRHQLHVSATDPDGDEDAMLASVSA